MQLKSYIRHLQIFVLTLTGAGGVTLCPIAAHAADFVDHRVSLIGQLPDDSHAGAHLSVGCVGQCYVAHFRPPRQATVGRDFVRQQLVEPVSPVLLCRVIRH